MWRGEDVEKHQDLFLRQCSIDLWDCSPCRFSRTGTSVAELVCAWKLRRGVPSPRNGSRWLSLPIPWSGWSGCRLQEKQEGSRTQNMGQESDDSQGNKNNTGLWENPPAPRRLLTANSNQKPTRNRYRAEQPACSWHPTPPGGHYCSSFWSKNFISLQMCCDHGAMFITLYV